MGLNVLSMNARMFTSVGEKEGAATSLDGGEPYPNPNLNPHPKLNPYPKPNLALTLTLTLNLTLTRW
eukprot:scaffold29018_cov75-Phaeocystis_antarctica.AAC.3